MTITAAAAADMPSGNNEKKKNGAGGDSSSIRSRDFTIDPNSVQAFRARKAGLAAFKELVYLKGQSKLLRSRSAVSASERVKLLDWSDIRIVKMLGKGSFSEVYSAVLRTTADGPAPVSGGESEGAEGSASSSTGDDSVSISVDDSTKSTGNGLDKTGKDASTYVLLNDVGGSGGRGVGYVGDINDSDYPSTEYAVKCIRDDIINDVNTHEDGTFEQAAIDLVVEGHILSKVQHENIIRLYAIRRGDIRKAFIASPTSSSSSKETTPDRGYFLMLEVLNDTLADRLDKLKAAKKNGRLSPAQLWEASMTLVANSAVGVAKGLKHMHRLNVVLRDLKPDNIGFNCHGITKLCDFGFAREVHTINPEEVAGSMRYMAPEVGLYGETSCACDVYSFGVLLYEICTLTKPFEQFNSRSKFTKLVFEGGYRPTVSYIPSAKLRELIEWCWHCDAAQRPKIGTVVKELEAEVTLYKKQKIKSLMNHSRSLTTLGRSNSRSLKSKMSSPSLVNPASNQARRSTSELSCVIHADERESRNSTWSTLANAPDDNPKKRIVMSTELKSLLGTDINKSKKKDPDADSGSRSPRFSSSKPIIKNNELRMSMGLTKCPPTRTTRRRQSVDNLKNSSSRDRISSFLKSSASSNTLTFPNAVDEMERKQNATFVSIDSQSSFSSNKSSVSNSNLSKSSNNSSLIMSRLNFGFMRRKPIYRRSSLRPNVQGERKSEQPSPASLTTTNS